jgi:mRNA interferase MazF
LKKGSYGFNEPCDIMIDQVRAIDNKRLIKKISSVPEDIIHKIKSNLKIILDID